MFCVSLAVFKRFYGPILSFFQSKTIWRVAVLSIVVLMTSGHMWNSIRNPPFIGREGKKMVVILVQLQSQVGVESQLISLLISVASLCLVILVNVIDPTPGDSRFFGRQKIVGGFSVAFFMLAYGFGIHVFQLKGMGYPFSLLY